MSKKQMIAGLVLCAGAPVLAQVNDVAPGTVGSVNDEVVARFANTGQLDAGNIVYHGSARVTGGNQVYMFDAAGVLTGQYDQIAGAIADAWGYRDGASDGTSLYFGWGGGVARHDADGSNGTLMFDGLNAPGGTWRALAFDPTGDGGRGSLWSASFGSDLIEVDMTGAEINFFFNVPGWSLYGLSYDDSDGNLWGHTTAGEIVKIDTTTGMYVAGAGWLNGFANLAAQGGLSGYSELGGNLAAVSQGTPDEFGVYDPAGAFVLGPISMEGQTGSNGHLGIAVIEVESSCPACACQFDTSTGNVCDIFDFLAFQTAFVSGDPCAVDLNTSTGVGVADIFDFLDFQTSFVTVGPCG